MNILVAKIFLFAGIIPQRILDLYPAGTETTWIDNPGMTWFGICIAALLTFCMYSFLYKDNPAYKFGEHLYVGVSVGYMICIMWFNVMRPNLFQPLMDDFSGNRILIIPGLLGVTMLFRFSRQLTWVSRYALAWVVASGSGLAVPAMIQAMLLRHMSSTLIPLWSAPTQDLVTIMDKVTYWASPIVIFVGVLSVLVYFFFSLEHKGAVGKISQVGILYLMVTFGSAFGYTVMARVSLLIGRMMFLIEDWLGHALGA